MGLLSDPEYGTMRFARNLRKYHRSTCFLCFAGALAWFVALANRNFNNETYFSENALLPGLVTNEFNGERAAKQFYTELLDELQDKYESSPEMPIPWLVGKMSQLHLEVYTHNFTLNFPLGHGEVYTGTNVYGILRAPRASSLEALVVSVPYRPLASHHKGTAAGLALMLAFAQFARPRKYWAKDIIFLVTEHEQLGMQAWLEAYHGIRSDARTFYTSLGSFWQPGGSSGPLGTVLDWGGHEKALNPGKLKGRSGSIQAAINLEFHTPKIKYVEVKVEGLNGQLPNLDLVNLVHKLCIKSNIHHSYKNSYSWVRTRRPGDTDEWRTNLYTLLSMAATQLPGVPSGNHGLFHRFGIEAVTLEGREGDDPAGAAPRAAALTSANFYRLGVALESILRSLNNLLERFHQSYFFYLLAATDRFISIGQYMPSLCLLCVGMLLRALALWANVHSEGEGEPDPNYTEQGEPDPNYTEQGEPDPKITEQGEGELDPYSTEQGEGEPDPNTTEQGEGEPDPNTTGQGSQSQRPVLAVETVYNVNIVNVGINYLLVHLLGYLVMNSPVLFSRIGYSYNISATVSVYSGLCAISVLLLLLAPPLPRWLRASPLTFEDMTLLNVLVLLELATVCLSVGMHNFPLGLCMAALMTPVALVASVGRKDGGRIENTKLYLCRLVCLLSQPLVAVTLAISLYSVCLYSDEPVLTALARGRDANMHAVVYSVLDSMIYGNWLFNVVTALVLPMWIIFWQLLCNKVDYPTTPATATATATATGNKKTD